MPLQDDHREGVQSDLADYFETEGKEQLNTERSIRYQCSSIKAFNLKAHEQAEEVIKVVKI